MSHTTIVRVAGWSTERRIITDGNDVSFEVAGNCNLSCGACPSRIRQVSGRLESLGDSVKYRWTSRDPRDACFVVLENTGWKADEVIPRLSDLLALHISAS